MENVPRRLVLGGLFTLPMLVLGENAVSAGQKPASLPSGSPPTPISNGQPAPVPTGIPGNWKLVLDDDFDGTSLNAALWNTQYPWGEDNNGDGSENCYLPDNVAVDGGGNLVLTGQRGEVTGTGAHGHAKSWPYSSGQVNTFGKFSMTHGVLEARLQVPAGLGTWPAFWALPADGTWPPEVDVMEVYGNDPSWADMTYHWGTAGAPKAEDAMATLPGGAPFSSAFHVFGCAISKSAITWYLDGVEQWSFTKAAKIAELVPLYVVCNLAIGGAGGDPDGTPMPVHYVVDYIRAWKPA